MKIRDILSKIGGKEKLDFSNQEDEVPPKENTRKEPIRSKTAGENPQERSPRQRRNSFTDRLPSQSAEVREIFNYVIEPQERTLRNYFNPGFWKDKRQLYKKLKEKEKEDLDVYQVLSFGASPTLEYYVLTILSCIIATMGLIQNSVAVIIGAMIVAPLMTPILAFSLGTIWGDIGLVKLSLSSIIKGGILAIAISAAITYIVPLQDYSHEIIARTHPTLFDILVAITSGAVGAYGYANKKISNTLVGIAIAVALMPPLCTIGIGVGTMNREVAFGAALLFLINLVSISLAGAVVFWIMEIHPISASDGVVRRALYQIVLSLLILGGIALPVGIYMYEGYQMADVQKTAREIIDQELKGALVLNMKTERTRRGYDISITIAADNEPAKARITTLVEHLKGQAPMVSTIKVQYVKTLLLLE